MKIIPGNAQHIGSRLERQDDFGFSDFSNNDFVSHGGVLALLTDGMGGLSMGREASQIAKQIMLKEYESKSENESIEEALYRAMSVTNKAVLQMASNEGLEGDIGTTLVAAVIKDSELYWISVGDSRIYLYRDGEIIQLSSDHDYAKELNLMAAAGEITQEEAANHKDRNALISYLGLRNLKLVDRNIEPYPLQRGDRILLCSDGLYNTLLDEEIIPLIAGDPQKAAEALVDKVISQKRPRQDNVTVAILACEGAGFFELTKNLFHLPCLQTWRQQWRLVVCALLLGVLLSIAGSAILKKYWSHREFTAFTKNKEAIVQTMGTDSHQVKQVIPGQSKNEVSPIHSSEQSSIPKSPDIKSKPKNIKPNRKNNKQHNTATTDKDLKY